MTSGKTWRTWLLLAVAWWTGLAPAWALVPPPTPSRGYARTENAHLGFFCLAAQTHVLRACVSNGYALGKTGYSYEKRTGPNCCGEQFDADLGLYYNRARYLNQNSGRFWSMDEYEGIKVDPSSLHKYLYVHANPVSGIDPTGHALLADIQMAMAIAGNVLVRIGAPAIYVFNRVANMLASSNLMISLQYAVNSVYFKLYSVFERMPFNLRTGQDFEKFINPILTRLGAAPQVVINVGQAVSARADWVFNEASIIDAKLGQYISTAQFQIYLQWAQSRGGSITYITLTPTPQAVRDALIEAGENVGVAVNFISLTPF